MASIRALCSNGILLQNGSIDMVGPINNVIDAYMQQNLTAYDDVPLANAIREHGCTNQIHFIDIQFLDENDNQIVPHCGRYLKVKLVFNVLESCRNCNIGFGIRDRYGNSIMTFPTSLTLDSVPLSKGKHLAYCIIPKLPLSAGSYVAAVSAGIDNVFADYVTHAANLIVEDDDFFNTGRSVASHMSGRVVLCDHNWLVD